MKKVKNFLGKVEEVKAPKRWKSSPDAPPTQLAYVTQPEIDMLVKANIHGSMKGKPNIGPEGILSLDGLAEEDKAYDDAVDKSGNEAAIDNYFSNTGGGGNDNNSTADNIINNVSNYQQENNDYTGGDINQSSNIVVNTTQEEKKGKTAEEIAQEKAQEASKFLVNWWDKNNKNKYRTYGDRKNLFGGGVRNTKEKVQAKIADKLNKGYYKIVNGPDGQPLIIHASTGTPVNPYTGGIIDTQSQSAQGGGYQNEMAKITGVDPENAGVFSREYQTGNGLPVSEMKPEHALRFLMQKNKGAFEQFFNMNKEKPGFNPFSFSAIGTAFGSILNKITGPEALQVGNNLERAGWGKAVEQPDGSYKIEFTEKGANNWSKTFDWNTTDIAGTSFSNFISPEAVAKDQNKSFLGNFISGSKFNEQPIDLTNLINQGGYYQGSEFTGLPPGTFMTPQEEAQLGGSSTMMMPNKNFGALDPNLNPEVPFEPQYGFLPPITALGSDSPLPGTPPSQYPAFTPEGFRINAYNPSLNLGGSNQGGQSGQGGQGGQGGQDDSDTNTQGGLTYNVFGLPVNYDYTGGPERMMLGGGFKRDGQYIGPFNYKNGGIANFRGYGY